MAPSDEEDRDAFNAKWNRIRPEIEKWQTDRRKRRRIVQILLVLFGCLVLSKFLFSSIVENDPVPAGTTGTVKTCINGKCTERPMQPGEGAFTVFVILGGFACFGAMFLVARGMSDYGPWRAKACVFEHLGYFYDRRAQKFPFQRFEQLYLVPSRADFRIADHIEGVIDGVGTEICKAEKIEKKRRKRSSFRVGGFDLSGTLRRSRASDRFVGGLIIADCPKPFHGRTVVLPNDLHPRNLFSGAFQNIGERVELESDDFNSAFIVYSTDQVEARYLLTPTMMQRLLRLRKPTVRELSLGFDDGKVWIAFNDRRDWFPDPGVNGDAADPAYLDEMKKELDYIAVIFRELDLATTSKT